MRFAVTIMAALCGLLALMQVAEARVRIQVDLSSQTMHVSSAAGDYLWPISSARSGFRTPRGTFGVKRMETMHYSRKYHNSPMPHSIFFAGGYAIHGTSATGALGRPASHGCIRLAPQNAAVLYRLVTREGAKIAINGTVPERARVYARRSGHPIVAAYAGGGRARDGASSGFYLRSSEIDPSLGYARSAPGLGQWLLDPAGW